MFKSSRDLTNSLVWQCSNYLNVLFAISKSQCSQVGSYYFQTAVFRAIRLPEMLVVAVRRIGHMFSFQMTKGIRLNFFWSVLVKMSSEWIKLLPVWLRREFHTCELYINVLFSIFLISDQPAVHRSYRFSAIGVFCQCHEFLDRIIAVVTGLLCGLRSSFTATTALI